MLAVDIPSGVDGLTGAAGRAPCCAARTVTFAALKPGLLLAAGPELAGEVEVVDIGLDVSGARPTSSRPPTSPAGCPAGHAGAQVAGRACWVVAGSPGMTGAAHLAAAAAQRAGAGYVRLSSPGRRPRPRPRSRS